MRVSDIMTTDVISLNEDDNLDLAEMEMSLARIRHLPVTRRGRLVGLVTHRDILRAMCSVIAEVDATTQSELLKQVSVAEIMSREVRTVDASCEAVEAARILLESKYGCLPVVADGLQLVGIVTEADFVELALRALEERTGRGEYEEESREEGLELSREDDEDW